VTFFVQSSVRQDFYMVLKDFAHATAMLYHDQQAQSGCFGLFDE
jgi:hypothetical protein